MTPAQMAALHVAAMETRPWTRDEFAGLLESGARATGDDRAFALYRIAADEAELLTIATRPDARRRGHARSVLREVEALARSAGAARLFLEVAETNLPARALYASAGFEEVGRRVDYYRLRDGMRDAAIVMEKRL